MEQDRRPKPGQLYNHFKNKPYQIITVAAHADTGEEMVVYQALYGDFRCYIRPLDNFISEVDHQKYPDVLQKYRFELRSPQEIEKAYMPLEAEGKTEIENYTRKNSPSELEPSVITQDMESNHDKVNSVLLQFLDAASYYKKLEVITSNRKHMTDRLINDMAVALDCTVEEGPLDQRIQELIYCLQAMSRFEDKRLR